MTNCSWKDCWKKLECGCYTGWIGTVLLLLLRLYFGWHFFLAGKGKFADIERVAGLFQNLSIPFPQASVYLVATVETVGGLLLLVGLFSRLACVPLTMTMIVAFLTAHVDAVKGIFQDPGLFFAQDPFLFLLTTLLVLAFGPGAASVDAFLKKKGCCQEEAGSGGSCCS